MRTGLAAAAVAISLVVLLSACGSDDAGSRSATGDAGITVAAASDLRVAFGELGGLFTDSSGIPVTFSYGSSGQLAQQIENGAPFDLFASADVSYVDAVIDAGIGDPATERTYAFGRIVIWSRNRKLSTLGELRDESVSPIAIANPDHAPYGRAAKAALERSGVYGAIEPRLVYGENISDALRLAESGNAEAGIVALSLAITSDGQWTLIDDALHDPLEQALVVTAPDGRAAGARAFADFIASPEGRKVMERYGFLLPRAAAPADER